MSWPIAAAKSFAKWSVFQENPYKLGFCIRWNQLALGERPYHNSYINSNQNPWQTILNKGIQRFQHISLHTNTPSPSIMEDNGRSLFFKQILTLGLSFNALRGFAKAMKSLVCCAHTKSADVKTQLIKTWHGWIDAKHMRMSTHFFQHSRTASKCFKRLCTWMGHHWI